MVLEFPTPLNGWKLDAVGLLAVIGETTTETCVEPMTASYLCLLPRLIPAPQALIRPNRRLTLATVNASLVGVYSGATSTQLSYIANQIYPIAKLPAFSIKVLSIAHRRESNAVGVETPSSRINDQSTFSAPPVRRATNLEKMRTLLTPPDPMMKAKAFSPHNILSISSSLLTIALLSWAIIIEDGPAVISIVLLASATTMFCAASLWSPPVRSSRLDPILIPAGDVVIRTKEGAFLVIKCNESVARELYFGTDDIHQAITTGFGLCVGIGTVVFMVAVIMMGNCSWTMQAALAVTYLLLNAVYWFVALMPSNTHWDFPRYEWMDITPDDCRLAHEITNEHSDPREGYPSFTRTLWYAIRETKRTRWVSRSGAAPETDQWVQWVNEAERAARQDDRTWPAVQRKDEIMKEMPWQQSEQPS